MTRDTHYCRAFSSEAVTTCFTTKVCPAGIRTPNPSLERRKLYSTWSPPQSCGIVQPTRDNSHQNKFSNPLL